MLGDISLGSLSCYRRKECKNPRSLLLESIQLSGDHHWGGSTTALSDMHFTQGLPITFLFDYIKQSIGYQLWPLSKLNSRYPTHGNSQARPFWATLGFVHFMVLLTSFSFTLKLSVTFLPLSASPPRLKSFLCSRIVFSFSTGTPFFRPVIVLFAARYLLPHSERVSNNCCQFCSSSGTVSNKAAYDQLVQIVH